MNKFLTPETHLRIDRHFVYHITNFKKYGTEDERLIKALIIYMSYKYQKDLFGYITLDPAEFGSLMNYDRKELFAKHPNPIFYTLNTQYSKDEYLQKQLKHGNLTKYRIWDNYLENALLILQNEKFYYSEEKNTKNEINVSLSNFIYIKDLEISFIKTGKTKKIIYKYRPTEEFEVKLQKLFLSINLEIYKSLRKPSLDDLYFKLLVRIYNETKKGRNQIKYNIIELAELVNISTENINKYFSVIKSRINSKIIDKLIPEMKKNIPSFNFEWTIEGKYKVPNVGVFSWVLDNLEVIPENKIYTDVFLTRLYKDLFANFQENYLALETNREEIYNKFLRWILSIDDFKIKKSIYIAAYSFIKGNTPEVDMYAQEYFYNLIDIGKSQEKHHFINVVDSYYILKTPESKPLNFQHIKDLIQFLIENKDKVNDVYPK